MQPICNYWRLVGLVLAFLFFSRDVVAAPDFDALEKSVVRIVTQTSQGIGTGTGFVINDQGYIATKLHVIAGGNLIKAIPTNSNLVADGAGRSEEMERAKRQADDVSQKFFIWLILLGAVALAALLLALKKPRQQIIHAADYVSRHFKSKEPAGVVQKRATEKLPEYGLMLTGFDGNGNPIRIGLAPARFAGQRLGISLGRHPELVDEIIQDQNVSRRHARIVVQAGQFYIEDLNSRNGTFLDHRKLSPFKPTLLDYGALVRLGSLEFMVSKLE